jgi:hypothetical protein
MSQQEEVEEEQEQIPTLLKITPTREQLNRFIIWHTDTFNHGSKWRDEDFARKLDVFEKELAETGGSITLTDKYEIETWQGLVLDNFIIDDDYPNFP